MALHRRPLPLLAIGAAAFGIGWSHPAAAQRESGELCFWKFLVVLRSVAEQCPEGQDKALQAAIIRAMAHLERSMTRSGQASPGALAASRAGARDLAAARFSAGGPEEKNRQCALSRQSAINVNAESRRRFIALLQPRRLDEAIAQVQAGRSNMAGCRSQ